MNRISNNFDSSITFLTATFFFVFFVCLFFVLFLVLVFFPPPGMRGWLVGILCWELFPSDPFCRAASLFLVSHLPKFKALPPAPWGFSLPPAEASGGGEMGLHGSPSILGTYSQARAKKQ